MKYTLNNTQRIYSLLEEPIIRVEKQATKKDLELLQQHTSKLEELVSKSNKLFILRFILLIFLYISVISGIAGNTFLLSKAVAVIAAISGLVGSITIIILLALVQRLITLVTNEAQLHATYITGLDLKYR